MSTLDSLSQIVLGNRKVPSEKAAEIIPFLQQIERRHGRPAAIVHDMGTGIRTAVSKVFPDLPDFVCHFHFLRDLGKDLLAADYDALRARLRQHSFVATLHTQARRLKSAIDREPGSIDRFCRRVHAQDAGQDARLLPLVCAYSLIQWVLEGKKQGDGFGFPFDRPHLHLAQRALLAAAHLDALNSLPVQGAWRNHRPLFQLSGALKALREDSALQKASATLEAKIEVFDQLRGAMRIAETGSSSGLNSGHDPQPIGPIKKAVLAFRHTLRSRPDYASCPHWKILIAQIDRYSDKLFADPLSLHTPHGPLLLQPQRTNNILERFFRDLRRGFRRRTGRDSIGPFLQTMIADTPLVKNLENPLYCKALLNGLPSLERRFAQIDGQLVRTEMLAAQHPLEKVPAKIHHLIATPDFPEIIAGILRKAA
jgi:hypothetical protein